MRKQFIPKICYGLLVLMPDALLDVIITVDIFPWLLFGLLNKIFKKLNTLLNK